MKKNLKLCIVLILLLLVTGVVLINTNKSELKQ